MPAPYPWKVGEHCTVIGDTGTGKTYLISKLVQRRQFVVVLRTKPDDIRWPGFKTAKRADRMDDPRYGHIVVEPEYRQQARQGYELLERVWTQGGWTVVVDEFWYAESLGLKPYVERLLTQGRSKDISVVVGMQRPVAISRFAISQSTHVFSFRVEGRDAKTVAESTSPRMIEPLTSVRGHDFVYYNRSQRDYTIGNANRLGSVISDPKSLDTPVGAGDARA